MKLNQWTLALASMGVVSLASVAYAEEQAMSQVLTAVSSTTISGYVDTSAIWKPGKGNGGAGFGGVLPGRAFDGTSKMDGFNLNVVGLTIDKPLTEESWAAGYRVDLLFGPDAVGYNPSYFLGSAIGGGDAGVKQAYVDLRVPVGNGLDVKMGVWNTLLGYEVFESYLNPNYSRSYGWQLEPTQHTGLLTSYQLTEAVSVSAGVANVLTSGINQRSPRFESDKAFTGGITITAPDSWGFLSGSTLSASIIEGFAGNSGTDGSGQNTVNFYTGAMLKTGVEGLTVGGAFDYRFDGPNVVTPGDNWAWAIAGYLTYEATEKWKLSGRVDYTTGSDGTFYNGGIDIGNIFDGFVSDEQNQLFSVTATADYALWANVITRAEFRWDTALNDDKPFGISDENAVTLALNVVYKF